MKEITLKKFSLISCLLILLPIFAVAQFNSGSTGADGELDLSTMTCPGNVCEVQLPESGILNYTTVNIPGYPTERTLRFIRNSRNTPVIILAQGNVTINGNIDVSNGGYVLCPSGRCFDYRLGGPGGFAGGVNGNGFGPGGGTVGGILYGRWIGPLSLVPIIGGSGAAASCCPVTGGAGAIVIASSSSITVAGSISANQNTLNCYAVEYGSGGAIRLVSNTINYTGSIYARGNPCGTGYGNGVIRLEATNLSFTGVAYPAPVLSPINPNIFSSNQPQLTIASVGGYAVPSYAGSRFDTVDLLLPNSIPDPVNVVVQGVNIPVGTQVQVGFVSGSPNGTSSACTLSGGPGPLSCTATISNLNRTGVTYLLATAAFAPPAPLAQYNPKGKDQVATVRLETILGKAPKYIFLRSDKSPIDAAKVPKPILQYFGM